MRYRSFKFSDYIFLLDLRDSIPFTIFRNRRIKYLCVLLEGKRRCRGGGSCDSNGDCSLPLLEPRLEVCPKGVMVLVWCFAVGGILKGSRRSDWLLQGVSGLKPQGAGINLRGYEQPSTVIRIISVPRRVGGRCTGHRYENGLRKSWIKRANSFAPTDDPIRSRGVVMLSIPRRWNRPRRIFE